MNISYRVITIFYSVLLCFLYMLVTTSHAYSAKKVALVIGNSNYLNASPLRNPKNDAVDMSEKLVTLGFQVIGGFDLGKQAMKTKIRDFSRALDGAEVSLLFYAGHAMQVHGRNYLAPVDTDIAFEADLEFETIPMDLIQNQMERYTKTSLIFLDACRDNPLTRSLWSKSRSKGPQGLAESGQAAEGTLIAFSTQPGNVALDGEGRNSPFTAALLANISRPNVEISSMMTDVRKQVHTTTKEKQLPWSRSSLLGRFYFSGGETEVTQKINPVSTSSDPTPAAADQRQITNMTLQKIAYETIQDSKDPEMFKAYIAKYEGSFFADLAKSKLEGLERQKNTQIASLDAGQTARTEPQQELASSRKTGLEIQESSQSGASLPLEDIAFQIQTSLKEVGCSPGRPDGKWGRKSAGALRWFAKYSGIKPVTSEPSYDLMRQLQSFQLSAEYSGRVCPVHVITKRIVRKKKRKSHTRKRNRGSFNLDDLGGAIIGGIIACKATRNC